MAAFKTGTMEVASPLNNGDGNPQLAPQVCQNCKMRKRKCSKEMPSCALCTKLLLKCDYEYGPAFNPPFVKPETPSTISAASPGSSTSSSRSVSDLHASSNFLASFSPNSGPATATVDIVGQVLEILTAKGEDVTSVVTTYFRTIDSWLPIMSQVKIQPRMEALLHQPNVELASLLLCMYLIIQTPDVGRNMQDSTYYEAKSLVSTQVASGKTSNEIIQAGLLLCLYEQCHGMQHAAQITMAGCSRLGLKMISKLRKLGDKDIQNIEAGRLWWGIVIVDRYMNLGVAVEDIYFATGQPSQRQVTLGLHVDDEPAFVLPEDVSLRFTPSGVRFVHHELRSSAQTTRLGPFCRTAEASTLLGETLELMSGSAYSNFINWNKSQALDDQLQRLAMSLLYQAINGWEECCGAIGIVFSALLSLHKRIWDITTIASSQDLNDDNLRATMAIRYALPPPATYCVYMAAMLHIKIAGSGFMAPEWKLDMECMKSTLTHFGRRWYIGQHYLKLIDIAIADELRARSAMQVDS